MEFNVGIEYPKGKLAEITEWWSEHREYDINEYEDHIEIVKRSDEQVAADRIRALKSELEKVKEDIEQEAFGLVRDDFAERKARAAEIVNELRVLEGKEPRQVGYSENT